MSRRVERPRHTSFIRIPDSRGRIATLGMSSSRESPRRSQATTRQVHCTPRVQPGAFLCGGQIQDPFAGALARLRVEELWLLSAVFKCGFWDRCGDPLPKVPPPDDQEDG